MGKQLAIFLLVVSAPGLAFGQGGYIGLYSDAAYTSCLYVDANAALVPVYVVHKGTAGATASRFKVISLGGFNMTFVGDGRISGFVYSGSLQEGMCIEYGECLASDILLMTVNYFAMGISPSCSGLRVVPDIAAPSGKIEMMDCAGNVLEAWGSEFWVNSNGSCDCGTLCLDGVLPCAGVKTNLLRTGDQSAGLCPTSPVERDSWGHIKALYN